MADTTRDRVIDAAVRCILEEGFYRASSNEIARRAGVTWGVIQYYFGSREALLVAVHEYAVGRLEETLTQADITGTTLEERVTSFAEVLWDFYRRPEFLAYVQVMLNLSHDPRTEQQTREALNTMQARLEEHLPDLFRQVLGDHPAAGHPRAAELGNFIFSLLRAMAIDQELTRATLLDQPEPALMGAERQMLIEAVLAYAGSPQWTEAAGRGRLARRRRA